MLDVAGVGRITVPAMATHTITTDDIDGAPDATTVVITVNGEGVEVDLADKSLAKLTTALEPFWNVGSPSHYDVSRRSNGRRPAPARGYDLAELRAWAARAGVELPQRGRIPGAIVERFNREG
jgi:hypothetical protein